MHPSITTAALAAGLMIAHPAWAQTKAPAAAPAPAASTSVAAAQSGVYHVEPNHTRVQFSVTHLGFTTYWGDVTGASGDLDLDAKRLVASKVSISIPTASVSTTNPKLDGELKSPMFLDAAAFPTITFTSNSVIRTGPRTARITGDLTLHGVSHPVTLQAKFNAGGANPMSKAYTVGFDAVGHLNRSDFGVKAYVPAVSDRVDIRISAAFEKVR